MPINRRYELRLISPGPKKVHDASTLGKVIHDAPDHARWDWAAGADVLTRANTMDLLRALNRGAAQLARGGEPEATQS